MRKLRLDLDELAVESFTPESAGPEHGGTVHGHAATRGNGNTCNSFSCAVGCTLQESCAMPCATG